MCKQHLERDYSQIALLASNATEWQRIVIDAVLDARLGNPTAKHFLLNYVLEHPGLFYQFLKLVEAHTQTVSGQPPSQTIGGASQKGSDKSQEHQVPQNILGDDNDEAG